MNMEDGRPFGEMLTCVPDSGAEAVKKTDCFNAQAAKSSEMQSKNLGILKPLIVLPIQFEDRRRSQMTRKVKKANIESR